MAKRVDANQPQITKDLRKHGALVQCIHEVGKGCPDIMVGFRGKLFLFEIKDPNQPPSRRKLTKDERLWHDEWRDYVWIVHSAEEALTIMLAMV